MGDRPRYLYRRSAVYGTLNVLGNLLDNLGSGDKSESIFSALRQYVRGLAIKYVMRFIYKEQAKLPLVWTDPFSSESGSEKLSDDELEEHCHPIVAQTLASPLH